MTNKNKLHHVYRIDAFGKHYFGYTSNPESRMWGHCKSIKGLLKSGKYVLSHKETRTLKIHNFIATQMRNKGVGINSIKYSFKMVILYTSEFEKDALDVETFLTIKSMKNKNCLNTQPLYKDICKNQ